MPKLIFLLDDGDRKLLVAHAKILSKICPQVESIHIYEVVESGIYFVKKILWFVFNNIFLAGMGCLVKSLKDTLTELNNNVGLYHLLFKFCSFCLLLVIYFDIL